MATYDNMGQLVPTHRPVTGRTPGLNATAPTPTTPAPVRRYPDQWGRPPQHPEYGQPPANGAAPPPGSTPPPETPYQPPTPPDTPGVYRNQVQDQWGRSPSHPDYGKDPNAPPSSKGTGKSWANGNFSGAYGTDRVEQKGGTRFEGFNDDRALGGGDAKSTKDLFRRVVGGLGIDLVAEGLGNDPNAMANAERLSRERIVPALEAAGAEVLDIKNDKILIRTAENPAGEWVDIYGDVGRDPRFWWGADGTSTASTGSTRTVDTPGDVNTTMPAGTPSRDPYMDEYAYEELARRGRYGYPSVDDILPPLF